MVTGTKKVGFTKEQFEEIGDYVKARFFIVENQVKTESRFEHLLEKLDHQRELMIQGFEQVDKRFEQVDKRFEQVDKRFEDMQNNSNIRFREMQHNSDKRFEQIQHNMDARFDQMNNYMKVIIGMGFTLGLTIIIKLYFG